MGKEATWREFFSEALRESLEAAKGRNKNYSLRSYAKRIGLPVSTLSEILSGKPVLSKERAAEVVERLSVSAREKRYLLHLMDVQQENPRLTIDASAKKVFSDPAHLAVLYALELDDLPKTSVAISGKLKVSSDRVEGALKDLTALGMARLKPDGQYEGTGASWATLDGTSSADFRAFHAVSLGLAKDALEKFSVEERDISSVTFASNENKIPEMRQELRRCIERMSTIGEAAKSKNKVYRVLFCLYPLEQL